MTVKMKNRLTRFNNHLSIEVEVEGTFFGRVEGEKLTRQTTTKN
jgi:hypothetical protein